MDNLAPAILQWLLTCLLVLAAVIGALVWWQRRFRPSSPAKYATWGGLVWSYLSFCGLAIVPQRLIASTILTTAWRGILLVTVTWIIVRLFHSRESSWPTAAS